MAHEEIDKKLGALGKKLRLKKTKTQIEMAEDIGIGETTLRRFEKGIQSTSPHLLNLITNYLGYSLSAFIKMAGY